MLKVDRASVQSARAVLDRGAPELVEAVERGDIAVSAAADLSALPLEEQRRVIETADKRALGQVVKAVRAEKQQEKRERREARETGLAARQRALPEKRYGVIYADPEWRFEPYSRDTGMDRAADNHYPTSHENDIVLRPVGDIAAKDCVLFLWATAPMLLSAIRVLQNWGFTYKTHWIWEKDRIGTGYWNRNQHELLLVGTRGDVPAPAMGDQWPSVITAPVGEHSAKPEVVAEMIEAYFPSLPKIELNARRARPGWDVWGLEAPDGEHHEQADSPDLAAGSQGGEATGGLCGSGDEDFRPDGASGSTRDTGEEGGGRAGGAGATVAAAATPSAVAREDGTSPISELTEWSLLRAIDNGEDVGGPGVDFLIAMKLARRDGAKLKTTMLGGMRFMNLTRLINAPPEQRAAMRAAISSLKAET